MSNLNNYPLLTEPYGICQGPENFQTTELPGAPPRPKHHPTRTGRVITYVHVQHPPNGFILHTNNKTRAVQASRIQLVTSVVYTCQYEDTDILWV